MSLGELVPVFFYEVAFFATMMFLPVMAFKAEVETFVFGGIVMFMCLRVIKKRLRKMLPADGKAVFITGCDTGFGHMAATRLHSKGYNVFAGCLEPDGKGARDLKEKCPDRMHIVSLDVTDDVSVRSAKEYVENNLDGTCRVVVMSSNNARFPWPSSSAYTATKMALECVTSSLRIEMKRFGVKVTSVQPALFGGSTEIHGERNRTRYNEEMERCWDTASDEIKTTYHKKYIQNQIEAIFSNRKSLDAKSPDPVIDAIEFGVSGENPDHRYVVHGGPFYVDPLAIYGTLYGFLPEFITDWFACKVMGIVPQPPEVKSSNQAEVNGAIKHD